MSTRRKVVTAVGMVGSVVALAVGSTPSTIPPPPPLPPDCTDGIDHGRSTCGMGVCKRSVPNCVEKVYQPCTPGTPSAEVCNQLDDDCDGDVDEGLTCKGK